jgi:5-methylcytosine-specific restriction protein A
MPTAPAHYCAAPGCSVLVPRGRKRCATHSRDKELDRGWAQDRGYTAAWARYSKDRLAQFPFCADPLRVHPVRVRATVTDHIVSARVAPERFWDPANHRSLCYACNQRVQRL